ncbi:DUF6479 family protein [Streptomyces virginiae]|uniref:DUF6479 family protein n=1 Tax=Streptomyces virginiae TaxID=1961 RepID=UPI0035E3823D
MPVRHPVAQTAIIAREDPLRNRPLAAGACRELFLILAGVVVALLLIGAFWYCSRRATQSPGPAGRTPRRSGAHNPGTPPKMIGVAKSLARSDGRDGGPHRLASVGFRCSPERG